MEYLTDIFGSLIEPAGIVLILVLLLFLNSWLFNRLKSFSVTGNIIKRSISIFIVLIGIVSFVLALPVDQHSKEQILSFLGIVISAGIALSSTTLLGNLIAGIMNNTMKRFRNGDLIQIDQWQGRVTRKGIFHSEIQLEDSNFVTIPNLFIASHPVKITRKTNTVISTTVSLGYDISRFKIEEALKEAAINAELKDPYVYITGLEDHAVVYKIHGFLEDSTKFFSANSLLNGRVMDALHKKGIEIVSPGFRNQRRVEKMIFIPEEEKEVKPDYNQDSPEELIFDEAIKSEEIEKKKDLLKKLDKKKVQLKEELKKLENDDAIEKTKKSIDRIDELTEEVKNNIENENKRKEES
ncbi:mechanosensitive ion channel family protein [Mariniphaga sp.]|uniref:mechanosensitive ion channel family protein n=1 Tax=Mariniphaga sp. TaxID=1954475 RepID=UPI0035623BBC